MHWKYRRLDFAPPLIEHTEINEIKFADPDQRNESMSVMMARIIFIVRCNETIAPLTNATVINGNTTGVTFTLTQAMTSAAKLQIGFTGTLTPALGGAMRGYIYEIIVFNTTISNEDKQKVEGYLAWKWGIQGSLSTAHPYYLAPP